MTDIQIYLCIGVPTFSVLLGWVSNRSDFAALRAEMTALRRDMNQDMTTFRKEVDQDMSALRQDINQDMTAFRNQIYGEMVELHERVVKVEMKQENR